MTQQEALAEVRKHVTMVRQYRCVTEAKALELIGPEKLAKLKTDPIRGVGPEAGHFYYWNVADYLALEG